MTTQTNAAAGLTQEGLIDVPGLWSRWVRLPSGERAHYMTSGTSGPAVFLLHSLLEGSSGAADWHLTAPFLGEHGFRVYCPDMPGYGLSDTRRDYLDQKPKTHVDFVIALADALCISEFYLVGVGGGSMDAVKIAISNPDRLLGIVFISGAFGPVVDYATRRLQGEGSFYAPASGYVLPKFDGTEATMQAILDGLHQNKAPVTPAVAAMSAMTANLQREARVGVPPTPQDWNAHEIVWQTIDRIDKLDMPMLCLYGLQSTWLPVENGFAQEDSIFNIQFLYPDNSGHHVPLDQPELFNQLLLEFFGRGKVKWETAQRAGISRRREVLERVIEAPAGGFPAPRPEMYESLEALRAG